MYNIDRLFIGTLDDKKVTVISFDIINKIKQNKINSNDEFIFKTDKDIEKALYIDKKYINKFNLKVEKYKVNFDLYLKYKHSYSFKEDKKDMVEMHCEIVNYNIISKY
ncbi:hypothetical protein [Clostridium cochlearium]|uniref:hypothetical protein n=1 Tax=Clostridium cochlearium TaxID=1494 RepID=UPI001C0F3977|nr:hypothetical protein [Clostridium cochlearium]MBU5269476.1 hypothetical protein [Clostridium cochlearium]